MKFRNYSNMEIYLKCTSFVLGLLFIMHALAGKSSACAHQGEEGLAVVAAKGKKVAVPKGVLLDGGNASGTLRKLIGFGGRKMAERKVLSEETEVEDRLNGSSGTSEISGATHSDGIVLVGLAVKGGCFKVKCKLAGNNDHITPKKHMKVSGPVGFTADYQGPKRHPPKHN